MMLCASGGGRTDLGTLRWFHEVWLSDNTDASARLRMQWEASKFLPPMTIGAHVTRWGDQDLAFACAVALSARFGFDLDPATLTAAEAAVCREAAALYREIRDLVQFGELIRLIPPEEDRAALAYADERRRQIAVLGYQLADAPAGHDSRTPAVAHPAAVSGLRCPVAGVLPAASYKVRRIRLAAEDADLGISTGARLLADGLAWPLRSARTAVIWLLTRQAG
jgi:alpha-galactosidase